jgi:hypothetical protein
MGNESQALSAWTLRELTPGETDVAALAVVGSDYHLKYWHGL